MASPGPVHGYHAPKLIYLAQGFLSGPTTLHPTTLRQHPKPAVKLESVPIHLRYGAHTVKSLQRWSLPPTGYPWEIARKASRSTADATLASQCQLSRRNAWADKVAHSKRPTQSLVIRAAGKSNVWLSKLTAQARSEMVTLTARILNFDGRCLPQQHPSLNYVCCLLIKSRSPRLSLRHICMGPHRLLLKLVRFL